MKWNDVKIRGKIGIGYGFIAFLLLFIGVLTLYSIQKIEDQSHMLADDYIPSANNSSKLDRYWHEMMTYFQACDYSSDKYYITKANQRFDQVKTAIDNLVKLTSDIESFKEANNEFVALNQEIDAFKSVKDAYIKSLELYSIKRNIVENLYDTLSKSIQNGQITYSPFLARSLVLSNQSFIAISNRKPKVLQTVNHQILQVMTSQEDRVGSVSKYLNSVFEMNNAYMASKAIEIKRIENASQILSEIIGFSEIGLDKIIEMGDESNQIVRKARLIMSIVILLIISIAVVSIVFVSSSIARPITDSVRMAEMIAAGNLTLTLKASRNDEVGLLLKALERMSSTLQNLIKEIKESASNMADASKQMNSNAMLLSQGAAEQAASTEQISSSMEEIQRALLVNGENAEKTKQIAGLTANGIVKNSQMSNEAINSLKQISEKISIIDDIAFQTNLLALNAAVEAARAGQYGKGFSVVATEVRKLAERSQIASTVINKISRETMLHSTNAGKMLDDLTPEIIKTSQYIEEIVKIGLEQLIGIAEVNKALQQLNSITQQTAANSEELAASSEELAAQANQLNDAVSMFITNDKY